MSCENISSDNRETCVTLLPSSCIPFTGAMTDAVKALVTQCRPNINDVIKAIEDLIDQIRLQTIDTDLTCLQLSDDSVDTQPELNQLIVDQLCLIKDQIATLGTPIDPNAINVIIDLMCLQDPSCDPPTSYTLQQVLVKLITAYCNLLTRVTTIETFLNL